jgi:dihydrofolate reductase
MRLVRFIGSMSLDGYIAGPQGERDWIGMDLDDDSDHGMMRFDTVLIGRKTFQAMTRAGIPVPALRGIRSIVYSRTLDPLDYSHVTIESDATRSVHELRALPGKDIALFGGGRLFRSLLTAGLVDRVEVSLIPVLLGGGIPLLPAPANRATLRLRRQHFCEKTGTVALEYDIAG